MRPDGAPTFRRREAADMPAAYRVFRRSLFDYLHRIGMVDAAEAADPPIDEGWVKQRAWIEHLAATAAEDWVAEDPDGSIVGWAQSIERDGLLELTLFFVDPATQSRGIGRGLLERAFPQGRGPARAIVATEDPRALALYLRSGVAFVTTSVDVYGVPAISAVDTDLQLERVAGDEASRFAALDDIMGVEREVLGHGRAADVRFLLETRPAWLARRDGRVTGFAFGQAGANFGPITALDPADVPALMATVENDAAARGSDQVSFTIPMVNHVAVGHALDRRWRIDPFYTLILAGDDRMRLDRWVHTQPAFIV